MQAEGISDQVKIHPPGVHSELGGDMVSSR